MASRPKLHTEFIDSILESTEEEGFKRAYFQPPANVFMKYPCIKYSLDGLSTLRANDRLYKGTNRYQVILIDEDPDSPLHDKLLNHFQYISFDRAYTADGLNHKVYTLYY